jgi:3-phenylpropionate/trans-cinnamate dioxygenase ferredoxin subunit
MICCCVWFDAVKSISVTIPSMQPFDTKPESEPEDAANPAGAKQTIRVGRIEELPPGHVATVELPNGQELALCNVDGELFATENSCPHHGAPLAEGKLCGHLLECGFHGWQFDVRDGRGVMVRASIATYRVLLEEGEIKIEF